VSPPFADGGGGMIFEAAATCYLKIQIAPIAAQRPSGGMTGLEEQRRHASRLAIRCVVMKGSAARQAQRRRLYGDGGDEGEGRWLKASTAKSC
jgi:hypothetical protein